MSTSGVAFPQFGRQEIKLECLGELPPVPINAELMSWAFENLCKNAIDAMDGQAGSLRIRMELLPASRAVQIAFEDDGRGIEPEHVKRIFEPGFSTKKRGWGLGAGVCQAHRRRISQGQDQLST